MAFKAPPHAREASAARPLRPYQIEAVQAVRTEWALGVTRTAVVLPTGAGKTDVIARIATDEVAAGGQVLAIAHRGDLLDQIAERCRMHAPTIPVGRVQASVNQTKLPITVAMAPTLASEKRRALMPKPTLVICDEAHHAASPSQMAILSWAGSFDHVRTMGVTATMTRGDKRGLGDVWETIAFERDIQWAIRSGWLVEPKGRAVVVDHLDLASAKVSRGDFQDAELGSMVTQDVDQIAKAWQEYASDRITVAFTPNVESARALMAEFLARDIPTEMVLGSTPQAERRATYDMLAAGEIRVLVSVMVTTEGWDCPPVSCVLMARPTKLPGLYQQIVGRGLRPSPGKTDCLVLDVVGATHAVGGLQTLIDLHPSADYDTSELPSELAQVCEECGKVPRWCECEDRPPTRPHLTVPAQYEDVDLFAKSEAAWLFTRAGTRFLPAGDRMALLWQDEDETYRAGHCATRGAMDGAWIESGLDLDTARQLAEAWAVEHDPSVATRNAPWRRKGGKPSDKQLNMARGLGVLDPEQYSKPRLSDEISIAIASRRLDR